MAPYNARVAHDRLEKYYTRKKAITKYRRFQRFEERQEQQQSDGQAPKKPASGLLERVLAEGAEGVDEEYERRLALSFGGGGSGGASGGGAKDGPRPMKRKRRRAEAESAAADNSSVEVPRAGARDRRSAKARLAADARGPVDASAAEAGEGKPAQEAVRKPPNGSQKRKKKGKDAVPERFSKELRQYQQNQEAKEAERQRKLEDIRARNHYRREAARHRAVKGQLLSNRTARGQPRMRNVLEMVTAKLAGAPLPGRGAAGGRRANGRS